ncbi:hypothetical protein PA01_01570 [Azoarcus sp. PA01]|nr:hypothetical protein PA01_01570 [Azoarcus sp. PA01]
MGMALVGETLHQPTPLSSAQGPHHAWMSVAKSKHAALIPAAGAESPSAPERHENATASAAPAGLVAGLIISADMFVGNADSDRHTLTVRPPDSTREFKARVVGMPEEGPDARGERGPVAPGAATPLAVPPAVVPVAGDWRPSAKIRA